MLLVSLFLALAAAYLTSRRTWLGLIVVVLAIPFDFSIALGSFKIYTNEIMLAGLFVGWALALWQRPEERAAFRWQDALWVAPFLFALLLSGVNAAHFSSVIKQSLRWLEVFGLAVFAASTVRDVRDLRLLLNLIIGVGTAMALLGIVQTLAGPNTAINANPNLLTVYQGNIIRAYGTFGHSNQFAGYTAMAITVAFIQFVEGRSFWERIAVGVCTLLMVTALIFTFSRGAWTALILVGLVLIYMNIPKKLFVMGVLLLSIALVVVFLNQGPLDLARKAVVERVNTFGHPEKDDSVYFRKVCVQTAVKMFKQRPFLGFGAGEYRRNISNYFDSKYYAWDAIDKHIHNLYLQILIESGLLGLLSFLTMMGYYLFRVARCLFQGPPGYPRQALSGLLAGVIAFLIHNNFDVLTAFARGIHFGLMLGLALALVGYMEAARREPAA